MKNKPTKTGYFSKGFFSKNSLTAFCFLIVPLAVYTIFVIYPILQAVWFSMFKWNGLGPMNNFIGVDNFFKIFSDPVFRIAIGNNFKIVFLSLFFQFPLALFIALIIARKFRGAVVYRAIFFLPYILSEVIAGVLWSFIYNPQYGIQNTALTDIIPFLADFPFLSSPSTVFYSIFFVMIWKYFGLHMVLYIAGLQNIPQEIEEAARLDGVNWWQMNRYIILPLLKPTIYLSVFFSIVGSFQTFDIVWAMGKGEPVHAAETMVTYMYKFGFQRFQLGYGSAVAIVIFIITLGVGMFYQKITASKDI
jgi:raffinose/stachyose/melibiose transport system permease protein